MCITSTRYHMLFSIIKIIIFWTCKNLLNNKSLKGYQNHCVKWLWKVFGGRRTSSKLTLKTKWYNSCGYCDNSRSCEQLKRHVTDKYFEKKLGFEPESPVTGKVGYHYNSWVTGVCMACIFYWNSGGETSQIEWLSESNLKSFGCFMCSTAFWVLLNQRQLTYKNWFGTSGPDCHLTPKIGHLQKMGVAFKS